ncbi:unnamed protein product [Acanthoscelides obtectus]|uniref:Uncharacterized protein n=1 Tax=Acanthoscelides obtectus TaxID=200917 RepID=A0A9P0P6K0_ACAOB|nr:unnamed protein product [Acanthoscelides obtectus]CAK1628443.1 hypothetical protein AOBTE_LOCUS5216 [Acanthoscelides obtectus]
MLELNSNFHVKTPIVYVPNSQLRISKLTSLNSNFVEVNLDMPEKLRKEVYIRASWLIKSRKDFYSMVKLETPFNGLENTTAGIKIYISDEQSTLWSAIQLNPLEVEINSTLQNSILNVASDLNFNGKRFPLLITCKIIQPEKRKAYGNYISIADDYYEFDGHMKLKEKVFIIAGYAELSEDSVKLLLPSKVFIQLNPEDESPEIEFNFQVNKLASNKYKFKGGLSQSDRYVTYESDVAYSLDKLNWEIYTAIITSTGGHFHINTKVISEGDNVNLSLDMTTPIFKLENVIAGANYTVSGLNRNAYGFFEIINVSPRTTQAKGSLGLNIVWLVMENMAVKAIGQFENVHYSSKTSVVAFYENPGKAFQHLKVGGDIAVDKIWEAASNITVNMPPNKTLGFEGHLKTPYGDKETHSLYTELEYSDGFKYVDYLAKYRTLESQKKYGTWGQISIKDKQNLTGNVEVQWDGRNFNNFANLRMSEKNLDLIYKLKTPKFDDKRMAVAQLSYIATGERHNITCDGFYPEDRSVMHATVDYKELANMHGMFNITLPYKALNHTGAYFRTETNE